MWLIQHLKSFQTYGFPPQGGVCAFKCSLLAMCNCSFGFHTVLWGRWWGCVFYRWPNRFWKADLPKITQSDLGRDQRSLWFLLPVHCLPWRSARRWKEIMSVFPESIRIQASGINRKTSNSSGLSNIKLISCSDKRMLVVDRDDKVLPRGYQRTRLLLSSCSATCGFHF